MHVHKQIVYLSIRNDINSYYKIKGKNRPGINTASIKNYNRYRQLMVCAFGAGEQHHNDGLFCARLLNCTALAQIERQLTKFYL